MDERQEKRLWNLAKAVREAPDGNMIYIFDGKLIPEAVLFQYAFRKDLQDHIILTLREKSNGVHYLELLYKDDLHSIKDRDLEYSYKVLNLKDSDCMEWLSYHFGLDQIRNEYKILFDPFCCYPYIKEKIASHIENFIIYKRRSSGKPILLTLLKLDFLHLKREILNFVSGGFPKRKKILN